MSTPCPRSAASMNQKLFMMVKVGLSVSESLDTAACVPMDLTGFPVHVKIASYRGSGLKIDISVSNNFVIIEIFWYSQSVI